MSFLIFDKQLLGPEDYLKNLPESISWNEESFLE